MTKQATTFWPVSVIIQWFLDCGCELRVAEPTIILDDGDCVNARYLFNPANGRHAPLVDLLDSDQISELELVYWERRLDVEVKRHGIH